MPAMNRLLFISGLLCAALGTTTLLPFVQDTGTLDTPSRLVGALGMALILGRTFLPSVCLDWQKRENISGCRKKLMGIDGY